MLQASSLGKQCSTLKHGALGQAMKVIRIRTKQELVNYAIKELVSREREKKPLSSRAR